MASKHRETLSALLWPESAPAHAAQTLRRAFGDDGGTVEASGARGDRRRGDLLHVLIVEDRPEDAEMIVHYLERGGFRVNWQRVDTEADFLARAHDGLDIIISDYHMPQFGALRALELLRERKVSAPVIVVSGMIGEDKAVATIQLGASDYLLKDHLARLSQVVTRAIREKKLREEKQRAEEQLQRQVKRLAALRAIDTTITASFDIRVTLATLLDHLIEQLEVDAVNILRLSARSLMLEFVAGRGFRHSPGNEPPLRVGQGPAGRAVFEQQMVHVSPWDGANAGVSESHAAEGFVSYYGVPLVAKGQTKGILQIYNRKPISPDGDWMEMLNAMAVQAALAIDNAELFERLQRSNIDLTLAYEATLEGWARALEMRDHETEGHTSRAAEVTVALARLMGLPEEELIHIRRGALLHDIGKMAIPDAVLLKPGPLTESEWMEMRKHPQYAYELLSPISFLRPALDIPYCHHEHWDGTGYPRGLKGEQIPLAARIFSVVDAWDALRSDRPYRKAWPETAIRDYLPQKAGSQFDPSIVRMFARMMWGD